MAEGIQKNEKIDKPFATRAEGTIPSKKPLSTLQLTIEHGLSFTILIPAIASFFIFLLNILFLSIEQGAGAGLIEAFASGGKVVAFCYALGFLPSAITGFLAYPLWRSLNGGKKAWLCIVLINGFLMGPISYIVAEGIITSALAIFAIWIAATLASLFLTRKLRFA